MSIQIPIGNHTRTSKVKRDPQAYKIMETFHLFRSILWLTLQRNQFSQENIHKLILSSALLMSNMFPKKFP